MILLLRANKDLPNLFPKGGDYTTSNISPKLGTEIKGIQLSQLNDAAKDEGCFACCSKRCFSV